MGCICDNLMIYICFNVASQMKVTTTLLDYFYDANMVGWLV
jgi:hypothetical protein